jgi:PBSX family phage terminase large subunit
VLRPALTDHKGEAMFISTPKGFNHFFNLFNMEGKDKDYKSFKFTSYDNPFMDSEEIDKAKDELNEDQFYQEYMADFRKMEGLVYKEFNRVTHVKDFDEEKWGKQEFLGAVDFGFTNPCAVLDVICDYDNRYFVVDEYYQTGLTDDEISDFVASKGYNKVYPDPENAGGVESLKRKRVSVREVRKGKESVKRGINIVRDLLKQNRLFISPRCKNLIWELETYHYPEGKDDRNEEEVPVKKDDHALDALRYVLSMHKPIMPARLTHSSIPTERTNIGM